MCPIRPFHILVIIISHDILEIHFIIQFEMFYFFSELFVYYF